MNHAIRIFLSLSVELIINEQGGKKGQKKRNREFTQFFVLHSRYLFLVPT